MCNDEYLIGRMGNLEGEKSHEAEIETFIN